MLPNASLSMFIYVFIFLLLRFHLEEKNTEKHHHHHITQKSHFIRFNGTLSEFKVKII